MVHQLLLSSRRSTRLPVYDYRRPGAYFVTICTWHRQRLFGGICDGCVHLSTAGKIAGQLWTQIPEHFPCARIDEFVVMPDHVHGILVIERWSHQKTSTKTDDATLAKPTSHVPPGPAPGSLGAMIGSYKSIVTREINRLRRTPGGLVWQRNYHERIIRDDRALRQIRRYIRENPRRASKDGRRIASPPQG